MHTLAGGISSRVEHIKAVKRKNKSPEKGGVRKAEHAEAEAARSSVIASCVEPSLARVR